MDLFVLQMHVHVTVLTVCMYLCMYLNVHSNLQCALNVSVSTYKQSLVENCKHIPPQLIANLNSQKINKLDCTSTTTKSEKTVSLLNAFPVYGTQV